MPRPTVVAEDLQRLLQGDLTTSFQMWPLRPERIGFEQRFLQLKNDWYDPGKQDRRELEPNPAYDEASRIVAANFCNRLLELGLVDESFIPFRSNYPTSEELHEGGLEIRRFFFLTSYQGVNLEIVVDFFHSHDRLEFPQEPLVTVKTV